MANPFASAYLQVSPTFRLRITIDQIVQNWKKNTSDVQVKGYLYNDGAFYVHNEKATVDRSITGEQSHNPDNFTFDLPPHSNYVFISHTFTVEHDGATGMKGVDFTVTYGDTGTAESDGPVSLNAHLDLSRIPQPPVAPPDPTYTNIKTTSVTVSWGPSPNNNGSKVTAYTLRRWNENHTRSWTSTANNLSRNVTGLTAGATYIFEVRAENARGAGSYSGESLVDLSGGGAVRINGLWKTCECYIRSGGKWVEATPYVRIGGVWKQAK